MALGGDCGEVWMSSENVMRLWMLFGGKVSLDRSSVEIAFRHEGQDLEKWPTPR